MRKHPVSSLEHGFLLPLRRKQRGLFEGRLPRRDSLFPLVVGQPDEHSVRDPTLSGLAAEAGGN